MSVAKVMGINIGILAVYTSMCFLSNDGMLYDVLFLLVHVVACLIVAIAVKRWVWVLSALIVLLIGFSTCVTILPQLKID